MSAAVAEKTTATDIAAALGVESMPLADLRKLLNNDLDIARAWASGDIEFGHQSYCVTGPVGKMGSVLVVEDGFDWTGPKHKLHKSFRDILTETPPKTEKCKRYEWTKPTQFGEEPQLRPVEISEREAHEAIALQVRLTDKGLGSS